MGCTGTGSGSDSLNHFTQTVHWLSDRHWLGERLSETEGQTQSDSEPDSRHWLTHSVGLTLSDSLRSVTHHWQWLAGGTYLFERSVAIPLSLGDMEYLVHVWARSMTGHKNHPRCAYCQPYSEDKKELHSVASVSHLLHSWSKNRSLYNISLGAWRYEIIRYQTRRSIRTLDFICKKSWCILSCANFSIRDWGASMHISCDRAKWRMLD